MRLRSTPVHVETKVVDVGEGIVERISAVTGNLDAHDDIIIPGAMTQGL
jgi:hypothetical protein